MLIADKNGCNVLQAYLFLSTVTTVATVTTVTTVTNLFLLLVLQLTRFVMYFHTVLLQLQASSDMFVLV